jgi:hypothetical protein
MSLKLEALFVVACGSMPPIPKSPGESEIFLGLCRKVIKSTRAVEKSPSISLGEAKARGDDSY